MEMITGDDQNKVRELYEKLEMIVVQSPTEPEDFWHTAQGLSGTQSFRITQVLNLGNRVAIFVSSQGPTPEDHLNKSVTKHSNGSYYLESGPIPLDLLGKLDHFRYT